MITVTVGVSARVHSVVRFWAAYPGRKSGVPTYIRTSPGYNDSKVYVKGEEQV